MNNTQSFVDRDAYFSVTKQRHDATQTQSNNFKSSVSLVNVEGEQRVDPFYTIERVGHDKGQSLPLLSDKDTQTQHDYYNENMIAWFKSQQTITNQQDMVDLDLEYNGPAKEPQKIPPKSQTGGKPPDFTMGVNQMMTLDYKPQQPKKSAARPVRESMPQRRSVKPELPIQWPQEPANEPVSQKRSVKPQLPTQWPQEPVNEPISQKRTAKPELPTQWPEKPQDNNKPQKPVVQPMDEVIKPQKAKRDEAEIKWPEPSGPLEDTIKPKKVNKARTDLSDLDLGEPYPPVVQPIKPKSAQNTKDDTFSWPFSMDDEDPITGE